MLNILDRYIIRKFLSTFFFALGLIICVAIVIDLSEKMDDFIQNHASVRQLIFDYYIFFIPWFYNLFNNLFIFIAVIFFTSKMASNSEIISILASGVSYRRLMRPYLITAIFLGSISWLLNSWVIPYCNHRKVDFENQYINGRRNEEHWHKNIHSQIEPDVYLFLDNFSKKDSVGYKFSLERFEGTRLLYKLSGERFSYNAKTGKWKVENYVEKTLHPETKIVKGMEKDLDIRFNPQEFFLRKDDVGIFNNTELNRMIEEERLRGAENIDFYLVEKYRRQAMPFSTILLTVIGLTISSRKVRGGIGLHLGFGLAIAFGYIFVSQMTFTFAHAGDLSPLAAVWLPNMLFVGLAWWLYGRAPK